MTQSYFVNLTPHDVHAYGETFESKKDDLRLLPKDDTSYDFQLPDSKKSVKVANPPNYIGVTPYNFHKRYNKKGLIMSKLVADYLIEHLDEYPGEYEIFCPDTNPGFVVRDDKGQIIGTKRFIRYKQK